MSNVLIPKMYFKPMLSGHRTQEQDHTHRQGAQRLPGKQLSHIHNPDLLLPWPAQILAVGFTLMLNCFMISVYKRAKNVHQGGGLLGRSGQGRRGDINSRIFTADNPH